MPDGGFPAMDETDLLSEVQELTWAMVDEQATEKEIRRLERLLVDHDDARQTYVMCMQMHADLHFLLNPPPPLPAMLQKLIEAEKTKKSTKTALPLVDLPSTDSHSFTNGRT
jgi:hypothetical protein